MIGSPVKQRSGSPLKRKKNLNESVNSSADANVILSQTTALQAQMLEKALQSAKKPTPIKEASSSRKTPGKALIKLPSAFKIRQNAQKNQNRMQKKFNAQIFAGPNAEEAKSRNDDKIEAVKVRPSTVDSEPAKIQRTIEFDVAQQTLKLSSVEPKSKVEGREEEVAVVVFEDANLKPDNPTFPEKPEPIVTVVVEEQQKTAASLLGTKFKFDNVIVNPKTAGAEFIPDLFLKSPRDDLMDYRAVSDAMDYSSMSSSSESSSSDADSSSNTSDS